MDGGQSGMGEVAVRAAVRGEGSERNSTIITIMTKKVKIMMMIDNDDNDDDNN